MATKGGGMEKERMKLFFSRVLLLLSLLLVLPFEGAGAEARFGYVLKDKVLFRKTASGSDYWAYLSRGFVAEILGEEDGGGFHWYWVSAGLPDNPSQLKKGYLRADVFSPMTEEERGDWLKEGEQVFVPATKAGLDESPEASTQSGVAFDAGAGQIRITKPGTWIRKSAEGEGILKLRRGLVLTVLDNPLLIGEYSWIYAQEPKSGVRGYVRGDCYEYSNQGRVPLTVPQDPAPSPKPPAQEDGSRIVIAQLEVAKNGIVLRAEPAGTKLLQLKKGMKLDCYRYTLEKGHTWYEVSCDLGQGYVREDTVKLLSGEIASALYLNAGDQPRAYVRLIRGEVNLRAKAASYGAILDNVTARGTVLPQIGNKVSANGYDWYPVLYKGVAGYLRGDCVQPLSEAEEAQTLKGLKR